MAFLVPFITSVTFTVLRLQLALLFLIVLDRKISSNPLRFFSLSGLRQIRLSSYPVPDNSGAVHSAIRIFLNDSQNLSRLFHCLVINVRLLLSLATTRLYYHV